jgi:hypothetical protein
LLATNKQIHFLSSSGGWTIPWKSVMNTINQANGVYLELTKKQGNGLYLVPDPTITEAILQTLMRIAKRQLVGQSNDAATRHIPHEIKIAVWQRDGGKCVQCGATSYLEYDHIIPFTKGGASTVNNVQILCRRCNLQKSDRI